MLSAYFSIDDKEGRKDRSINILDGLLMRGTGSNGTEESSLKYDHMLLRQYISLSGSIGCINLGVILFSSSVGDVLQIVVVVLTME